MSAPVWHRLLAIIVLALSCVVLLPRTAAAWPEGRGLLFGRVTDSETGVPLENANVYISSTSIGTTSGPDGTYRLSAPMGAFQLVGSRVGHALTLLAVSLAQGETLKVDLHLKPITLQREEVEVVAPEAHEWKRLLALFRVAFLGLSENAERCRIMNPEVINFQMIPGTSTLVASTDSVVRIENQALGYTLHIRFGMYRWDVADDFGRYLLYPRFEPLTTQSKEERQTWEENRKKTYHGSLKHFLASLVRGTVREEQFAVHHGKLANLEAGSSSPLTPDDYTLGPASGAALWKLSFKDWMRVDYRRGALKMRSYLALNRDSVLLDAYGNLVDPLSIDVIGAWTRSRVAELLPLYDEEPHHE